MVPIRLRRTTIPDPLSFGRLRAGSQAPGPLRRAPCRLRRAQDRRRGFAPRHSQFFSSLLVHCQPWFDGSFSHPPALLRGYGGFPVPIALRQAQDRRRGLRPLCTPPSRYWRQSLLLPIKAPVTENWSLVTLVSNCPAGESREGRDPLWQGFGDSPNRLRRVGRRNVHLTCHLRLVLACRRAVHIIPSHPPSDGRFGGHPQTPAKGGDAPFGNPLKRGAMTHHISSAGGMS